MVHMKGEYKDMNPETTDVNEAAVFQSLSRHQQPQSARWRVPLLGFLVVFAPLLTASPARGQYTRWQAGTGDWFVPSNWSLGVPTFPSGTADIGNGGTVQILRPGAA